MYNSTFVLYLIMICYLYVFDNGYLIGSTRFSNFLNMYVQVSFALKLGGARSLVLVDEFGKGTAPVDGMALLMGVVCNLADRGHQAPLAFFSSHYHQVLRLVQRFFFLMGGVKCKQGHVAFFSSFPPPER